MRELFSRIHDWFRRDALDRELTDELAFHQEQLERQSIANGAQRTEARRAARHGPIARVKCLAGGSPPRPPAPPPPPPPEHPTR